MPERLPAACVGAAPFPSILRLHPRSQSEGRGSSSPITGMLWPAVGHRQRSGSTRQLLEQADGGHSASPPESAAEDRPSPACPTGQCGPVASASAKCASTMLVSAPAPGRAGDHGTGRPPPAAAACRAGPPPRASTAPGTAGARRPPTARRRPAMARSAWQSFSCLIASDLLFCAPRGIRTPNRQIRSLVLYVDLVDSRRIWPAQVGRPVDLVGSRRVPSDRLDNQPDDQTSSTCARAVGRRGAASR